MCKPMQVSIETTGDLGRKMNVVVPAADVDSLAQNKLEEVASKVKMDGFRPGKVPLSLVKKQHGQQVLVEITDQLINQGISKGFQENNIQPAGQPRMEEGSGLPEEGKDYSFTVLFDVLPEIKPSDVSKLKLTKHVAEPTEAMVEELLGRLKGSRQEFTEKKGKAEMGNRVVFDAAGYLEGQEEPFEGSQLNDFELVLGSGQLIPGFEQGLVGVKAGDKKDVTVTFPEDYHAKNLAGQPAVFKCDVKTIQKGTDPAINDEFAKNFGAETVDDLMEKIKEQISTDLSNATEQKLKKELFDSLEKENTFTLPESMVNDEFNTIWNQQLSDLQRQGMKLEDLDKSEDELKTEFKALAQRRVRLGLLLAEIGKVQEIRVEKNDFDAEISRIAASNPGIEQQVREYYADPQRQQEITGPLFEKKVTDWIFEQAKVTEKSVDADKLLKELGTL